MFPFGQISSLVKHLHSNLCFSPPQVSSPLTQLTLHPSPQHPSTVPTLSQPLAQVKEENQGQLQSSCSFSRPSPTSGQPAEPLAGVAMDTSLDKDQMLQEKDKQIEELTRMLRQKQRLVETLRSQLEQGKMGGGGAEKEGGERSGTTGGVSHVTEVKPQTLIKASAIQPPTLPNGMLVRVKREVETEEGMEGVADESQTKKPTQPMQCSQETLLRLQQIHRLQVQQAEQQKQLKQQQLKQQQIQIQQQKTEAKTHPQKQPQTQSQQKTEAQILLQQQQLQQLIIQQTQQKQLQAQQKLAQQKLAQQKLAQQKLAQQNQLKQSQSQVLPAQKNQVQLKRVQVQAQCQTQTMQTQRPAVSQAQQKKQQRAQQRQQQKQQQTAVATQPVATGYSA